MALHSYYECDTCMKQVEPRAGSAYNDFTSAALNKPLPPATWHVYNDKQFCSWRCLGAYAYTRAATEKE